MGQNMKNPTISVFTVVPQNPKIREDTVIEGVKAAMKFADEIICFHCRPKDNTIEELCKLQMEEQKKGEMKISIIDGGDWDLDRFVISRKKNAALQHCTKDWCLLMDADEVFECKDVPRFKRELEKKENAFQLRYLHFYKNPWIIKNAKSGFYQWKPSLFKNHAGNFIGGLGIEVDVAMDKYSRDLLENSVKMPEGIIRVFHYGHCKTNTVTLGKKINQIEAVYKEDGQGQKLPQSFKYNMANTEKFEGQHPKTMKERVDRFKNLA